MKPRHQSRVLPEISGQIYAADIFSLRTDTADHLKCFIRGTIIYQNDFITVFGQPFHRFIDFLYDPADRFGRSIAGNDKTD